MKTTPIIPQNLLPIAPIIHQFLTPLLLWLSDLVYERLLAKAQDHLLVQLQPLLDFSVLETACAAYHRRQGTGRPIEHTVPQLLRALLVKYLYGCSLRELEERIRFHLPVKWFTAYPLYAAGPDHTTLHRFEVYLYLHHPRLFFDTVLRQIDAAFPDDRHRPQLGDTFALHANAALESLITRLRHLAQELLRAYRAADPAGYDRLWPHMDTAALFGAADEKATCYLSPTEWRQRLLATVAALLNCQHRLRQTPVAATVQQWLDRLDKLLADELRLEQDDAGRLIHLTLLQQRGTYRLCSATDPDATIRNHGRHKQDFGYNVSVLATVQFIREVRVDTGSRPDGEAIPDLLAAQLAHHDHCPHKLIYDQAAGWGKIAYQVHQVTAGRTQLVARPVVVHGQTDRFTPQDFRLAGDGLALTCPNGRTSRRRYRSGSGDGHTFRFLAVQCLGCSFLSRCRGSTATATTPRSVFISDYRAAGQRLADYSQTAAFRQDMRLRPQIERIIAGLVLHNDARRARFRGQAKVGFQVWMCATAYNVKRWVALRQGKRPPRRRRFGAPPPSAGGVGLVGG